jgi:hypothetical protein
LLVELDKVSATAVVAGDADGGDFVFRIELVINDVKTTAIMAAIRTPITANFCTNI